MQRYAFVASILMILGIAILGKALYTGNIDLEAAVELTKGGETA